LRPTSTGTPGTTDPGTTDPGTTDPGTTDPGAVGSVGSALSFPARPAGSLRGAVELAEGVLLVLPRQPAAADLVVLARAAAPLLSALSDLGLRAVPSVPSSSAEPSTTSSPGAS
jgi:hypothetical protein